MSKLKYILVAVILVGLLFILFNKQTLDLVHIPSQDNSYLNYDKSLSELLNNSFDKKKISILAEKSKYKLTVFYENNPLKSYPIVLGSNPIDDKLKDGDGCTPEGQFKVKTSFKDKKLNKFIWINYPNGESWKKYSQAKAKGLLKMGDSIGSKIGIHGVPENQDNLIDKKSNWTDGNISLKNKDIDEIFTNITDGIAVEIIK